MEIECTLLGTSYVNTKLRNVSYEERRCIALQSRAVLISGLIGSTTEVVEELGESQVINGRCVLTADKDKINISVNNKVILCHIKQQISFFDIIEDNYGYCLLYIGRCNITEQRLSVVLSFSTKELLMKTFNYIKTFKSPTTNDKEELQRITSSQASLSRNASFLHTEEGTRNPHTIAQNPQPIGDIIAENLQPIGGTIARNSQLIGDAIQRNSQPIGGTIVRTPQSIEGTTTESPQPIDSRIIGNPQTIENTSARNSQIIRDTIARNSQVVGDTNEQNPQPIEEINGIKTLSKIDTRATILQQPGIKSVDLVEELRNQLAHRNSMQKNETSTFNVSDTSYVDSEIDDRLNKPIPPRPDQPCMQERNANIDDHVSIVPPDVQKTKPALPNKPSKELLHITNRNEQGLANTFSNLSVIDSVSIRSHNISSSDSSSRSSNISFEGYEFMNPEDTEAINDHPSTLPSDFGGYILLPEQYIQSDKYYDNLELSVLEQESLYDNSCYEITVGYASENPAVDAQTCKSEERKQQFHTILLKSEEEYVKNLFTLISQLKLLNPRMEQLEDTISSLYKIHCNFYAYLSSTNNLSDSMNFFTTNVNEIYLYAKHIANTPNVDKALKQNSNIDQTIFEKIRQSRMRLMYYSQSIDVFLKEILSETEKHLFNIAREILRDINRKGDSALIIDNVIGCPFDIALHEPLLRHSMFKVSCSPSIFKPGMYRLMLFNQVIIVCEDNIQNYNFIYCIRLEQSFVLSNKSESVIRLQERTWGKYKNLDFTIGGIEPVKIDWNNQITELIKGMAQKSAKLKSERFVHKD